MLTIGVDPDTHYMSMVVLHDGCVKRTIVTNTPKELTNVLAVARTLREFYAALADLLPMPVDRICVEGQQVYGQKNVDPGDLVRLAHMAGGAASLLLAMNPTAELLMPLPQEWKGSAPKAIHQQRVLALYPHLQWSTSGKGSHLIDALGLAHWAAKKLLMPNRTAAVESARRSARSRRKSAPAD